MGKKTKKVTNTVPKDAEAEIEPEEAEHQAQEGEFTELPPDIRPYVERLDSCRVLIKKGAAKGMHVDAICYANDALLPQMLAECSNVTGFLPALRQMANVASLDGIVKHSLGMPDAHSGYGFSIGGVAAMDMSDPAAVVCPGGVGYDINCGVCLLRSSLKEADVLAPGVQEALAKELFARIPVGVGSQGGRLTPAELDAVMRDGLEFLAANGLAWPEDAECCEEGGRVAGADPAAVSQRARSRGIAQVGSLGSGNHYCEVQVVDEVYDAAAAAAMGIGEVGTVCVMIHSGSRGFGHQICADALAEMKRAKDVKENPNDGQLTGVPIGSALGKKYLSAMAAGANFAFANRGMMRAHARAAFEAVFRKKAKEELGMNLVYDVSHNIAKVEDHVVDGKQMKLLVHRKGATRAFGPGNPCIPEKYRAVGQPVIIGGSMGTCSYVLTGTQKGMETTFGSTCHGAGRALSRSAAVRTVAEKAVFEDLAQKGVVLKIASPHLVAEECCQAYKDVSQVVQTCHDAGIAKLCVRLRPLIVCKG